MRVLFLDCFSGISGDMTVGALCDLGVQPSAFEWELAKVDIGDFHLHFERGSRQGISGVKFGVHSGAVHTHDQDEPAEEHGQTHAHAHDEHCDHDHDHDHEEHHHHHDDEEEGRSYVEIRGLIERSDLSPFVKQHALGIFRRIAEAEAKIHGAPVEAVGFHEVGALDSIADIICACVGLEALGVEKLYASPLVDGRGWIDCAHGRFPVPAPATLEILRGVELTQLDEPHEMITPTGAAILAEFADGFGPMPTLKIGKVGYGLGTRDAPPRANVLRAVLGEKTDAALAADTVTQIETNIDDQSPEITGALVDRLLAAGALDAHLTPTQMKKNRPGVLLTVLCEPAAAPALADLIFTETSSFGVRLSHLERLKLDRRSESVSTPYGEVSVKLGFRGAELLQVAPEFESCRAVAEKSSRPLREVFRAAEQAYRAL